MRSRHFSGKNHKSGFVSRRCCDGELRLSDCGAASVTDAVIHKQPRLIKRLSLNIPPQRVA